MKSERAAVSVVLHALGDGRPVEVPDPRGCLIRLVPWPDTDKPYALYWGNEVGVVGSARSLAAIFVQLVGQKAVEEARQLAS